MSHCAIIFTQVNADAIQLNDAATAATVDLKLRFSGYSKFQAIAVASEMRLDAH